MARVLRMPEVSDDPSPAILTEWLVVEWASFASAQSLATVETEKLVVSVEVAEPGVLLKRLVETGERIEAGTPLAVLGDPGEVVTDVDELLVRLGLAEAPVETVPAPRHLGHLGHLGHPGHPGRLGADAPAEPTRALPRPLAHAWTPGGLHDEGETEGATSQLPRAPWTEPDPEVARSSALAESAASPSPEADETSPGSESGGTATVHPLGELTQVHLRATVRAEAILAVRDEVDELTVTDLVVKAVGAALLREPRLLGGRTTTDVAVAVLTDDGIATPVVRDVGSLTATSVAATLRARAERSSSTDHVGSAAVTVADAGRYGVEELGVDVTPARRAVLGVGAVRDEPVVEDGLLVPGSVMAVTLSVDESLADAAVAARWFCVLTELLEHPLRFLA